MKKRLFGILILVCLIGSILCACGAKKEITSEEAVAVMLEDLGGNAQNISGIHTHTGTYENEKCYNIYVTRDNEQWVYVISAYGKILYKGPGGHSH